MVAEVGPILLAVDARAADGIANQMMAATVTRAAKLVPQRRRPLPSSPDRPSFCAIAKGPASMVRCSECVGLLPTGLPPCVATLAPFATLSPVNCPLSVELLQL